jgi:hypothetical protein
MKYRISPFNCFFLFMLGVSFYYKLNTSNDPHTAYGLAYVIYFSYLLIVVDLFIQYIFTSYKKVLMIESCLIFLILFLISFS